MHMDTARWNIKHAWCFIIWRKSLQRVKIVYHHSSCALLFAWEKKKKLISDVTASSLNLDRKDSCQTISKHNYIFFVTVKLAHMFSFLQVDSYYHYPSETK